MDKEIVGHTATCSQTITVIDNEPAVVLTNNITVALDASGNASITPQQINAGSHDNCGIQSMSLNNSTFDCSNVGPNPVTLTVTDINGNSSSANAIVTVNDITAPNAIAQNVTVLLDANGNGSTTATAVDNGSSDVCGIASLVLSKTNFDCSNVGANSVTLTVKDVNGNVSTANAVVNVKDVTVPVVITQNIMVSLVGGTVSITPDQIDNGSTDACGVASITLTPNSFTCANIGLNTVTLKVTDVNGNSNTATATVNVVGIIPTCSISATPSGTIIGSANTYAATNQMYLGYGRQSMSLLCTGSGSGPYTYSWSGIGLSATNIANPVFTPTTAGNYVLKCIATNSYGCKTTCSITICVIDVRDLSAPANNPKVIICHVPPGNPNNTQTLSVGISAVPAHVGLHGGDKLGSCNATCGALGKSGDIGEIFSEETGNGIIDLIVYPNPSHNEFNLIMEGGSTEFVQVKVYDISGKLVLELKDQSPDKAILIDGLTNVGVFIADVTQGDFHKVVKLNRLN
jgi:hypothetical protein